MAKVVVVSLAALAAGCLASQDLQVQRDRADEGSVTRGLWDGLHETETEHHTRDDHGALSTPQDAGLYLNRTADDNSTGSIAQATFLSIQYYQDQFCIDRLGGPGQITVNACQRTDKPGSAIPNIVWNCSGGPGPLRQTLQAWHFGGMPGCDGPFQGVLRFPSGSCVLDEQRLRYARVSCPSLLPVVGPPVTSVQGPQ